MLRKLVEYVRGVSIENRLLRLGQLLVCIGSLLSSDSIACTFVTMGFIFIVESIARVIAKSKE